MKISTWSMSRIWLAGSLFALISSFPAMAQQNPPTVTLGGGSQPAVSAPASRPSASPAVSGAEDGPISVAPPDTYQVPTTPLKPSQAQANVGDDGTTVVGDKEAPIGLFITPWKDGYAEHGLDRPARFVDVDTSPIDPDTFQRRVNYYNVITDYRQAHLASGK